MLTLGNLFDGIGGWFLSANHAGITPVWIRRVVECVKEVR